MNKQIEEMRKFVSKIPYLTLDQTTESLVAQYLVNEGYHKTADVVREIFEEIERLLEEAKTAWDKNFQAARIETPAFIAHGGVCAINEIRHHFAELKKKYESEGADDV